MSISQGTLLSMKFIYHVKLSLNMLKTEIFLRNLIYKNFLATILTKFTAFGSPAELVRQVDGMSMEKKIGPIISEIFKHLMENKITPNKQN